MFQNKQKVVIGKSSRKKLIPFLEKNNFKRLFIITGKKSHKLSGASKYIDSLPTRFDKIIFNDFALNPRYVDAKIGAKLFLKKNCDCIISIGGGSVIDMGKIINAFSSYKNNRIELIKGKKKLNTKLSTLIAIPTTAGSGSECTHFAVIYYRNKKYSLAHKNLLPNLAIVDSFFTYTMSRYVTACSGFDALSQAIESFWSVSSNCKSRTFSSKAISLLNKNLVKAVNTPNKKNREAVMLASNLAGQAINITKTTAPHALSYKIAEICSIGHAHAVAVTLGYFFEINHSNKNINGKNSRKNLISKMYKIYSLLEVDSPIEAKRKWFKLMRLCKLEHEFQKIGINSELIINKIVRSVNVERLKNHPVNLTTSDLKKIFN